MIRIAIAEDDEKYRTTLEQYLDRYQEENEEQFQVTAFSDGMDLVEEYRPDYDILFLDIEMPHLDGMTTAKKIREVDSSALIIFITNMAQYAIHGYEVHAIDFVVKPVNYFAFALKLTKAIKIIESRDEKSILLPSEDRMVRVPLNDILYIEVVKHSIIVQTKDQQYTFSGTLKKLEEQLAGCHFSRCNHGCLVNLRNVTEVEKDTVNLLGHKLPISRPKKKAFLQELSDYIGRWGR